MNAYWFDLTGKVYADSPEQANKLLNRYAKVIQDTFILDIKITEINLEENNDETD